MISRMQRDAPRPRATLSPNHRQTFQQELIDLDSCRRARVSFLLIFPLLRFCLFPPHPTGQHCRLWRQPVGDLLPGERRGDPGPERSLPGAAEGVGEARSPEENTGQEPWQPSAQYRIFRGKNESFFVLSLWRKLSKCL